MADSPLRFARNCFNADSIVVARCECCQQIKIYLIDKQDRIRAMAETEPGVLEEMARAAAAAEPARIGRVN